jgi:hypothetical protein
MRIDNGAHSGHGRKRCLTQSLEAQGYSGERPVEAPLRSRRSRRSGAGLCDAESSSPPVPNPTTHGAGSRMTAAIADHVTRVHAIHRGGTIPWRPSHTRSMPKMVTGAPKLPIVSQNPDMAGLMSTTPSSGRHNVALNHEPISRGAVIARPPARWPQPSSVSATPAQRTFAERLS